MEQNIEMLDLLRKIERSERQKRLILALIGLFMLAAAVACVFLCIRVNALMPQVNGLLGQMETVLTDLEQTTRQLAALDLEGLVENVQSLSVYAQDSLRQTMEKLNVIDFETLNKAIEDLARVIEPLANFFGRF